MGEATEGSYNYWHEKINKINICYLMGRGSIWVKAVPEVSAKSWTKDQGLWISHKDWLRLPSNSSTFLPMSVFSPLPRILRKEFWTEVHNLKSWSQPVTSSRLANVTGSRIKDSRPLRGFRKKKKIHIYKQPCNFLFIVYALVTCFKSETIKNWKIQIQRSPAF